MARQLPVDEAEALRALLRETHEAMKDLRTMIRDAQVAKQLLDEAIETELEKRIDVYVVLTLDGARQRIDETVDRAMATMHQRFDEVVDTLLNEDPEARSRDEPSLKEYARMVREMAAEQREKYEQEGRYGTTYE